VRTKKGTRTEARQSKEEARPWWQEAHERHEQDFKRIRECGSPENAAKAGYRIDSAYEPNLVTGRCRCKACRAARDSAR